MSGSGCGGISELFRPLTLGDPRALGLKDDAAVLALPPDRELVVTADALVAGVHFRPEDPPDLIARKALRVNLSDLAAMGARPEGFFLCAAFPYSTCDSWLETFASGLRQDVETFQIPVLGGDTVATPGPLTLSLTALGSVEKGKALRRSFAQAGDDIYVSGSLGDGALGLKVISEEVSLSITNHREFLKDRYLLPQPRVALGLALVDVPGMGACMDISDGLVQDIGHICRASGVGAVVEMSQIPLSDATRSLLKASPELMDSVLTGGDDYELLFSARSRARPALAALVSALGLPITRIGRIETGAGVVVLDGIGEVRAFPKGGYNHCLGTN